MSPILGNFVGSIFTPLGGTPVCSGKNGTMPSGMSTLNLVGGGGNGTTGGVSNVGISGTIGITGVTGDGGINGVNPDLSSFTLAVIDLTNAKPTGILSKAINLLTLHLFLLLRDMQAKV